MAPKGTLAYWDMRGFGNHIRLLLTYLEVEFEDKRYQYGPGPDYGSENWLADKFTLGLKFPNIPHWIDDKVKLTERKAIYKYIAKAYGPQLVPADIVDQATADEVEGVVTDVVDNIVNVTYGKDKYDDVKEGLEAKLGYLNKHLEGKQYVIGDKLAYVDFFVYEALFQLKKMGEALKVDILGSYGNIQNYLARIESLPTLKEYIKSSVSECYGPQATVRY